MILINGISENSAPSADMHGNKESGAGNYRSDALKAEAQGW